MSIFVTCGNCTTKGHVVKHTIAEVRNCYDERYADEESAEMERRAEAANERFWENRGTDYGFEEWEARRGVIDFKDAWDMHDPSRLTYRDFTDEMAGI